MNTRSPYPAHIVESIQQRKTFSTPQIGGYTTPGGTYMITDGGANDSGKPRDLIAVDDRGMLLPLGQLVNARPLAEALDTAVRS